MHVQQEPTVSRIEPSQVYVPQVNRPLEGSTRQLAGTKKESRERRSLEAYARDRSDKMTEMMSRQGARDCLSQGTSNC